MTASIDQAGSAGQTGDQSEHISPDIWKTASLPQLLTELTQVQYAIQHVPHDQTTEAMQLGEREQAVLTELQRRHHVSAAETRTDSQAEVSVSRSAEPGGHHDDDLGQELAKWAAELGTDPRTHVANLEQALTTRGVIGRAQGILIERHQLTADQAFDRLRVTSSYTNQKLRDLAADLVATGNEHPTTTENVTDTAARRTMIGRAEGTLIERYRLTREQAAARLRAASRAAHRPIHDLAADLVETGLDILDNQTLPTIKTPASQ